MEKQQQSLITKDGVSYLLPFILVTFCFALWGFANDITNPMVKAFSKIFRMSVTDGTLVQVAFYGGYFCMAFPAAIFIRKFSYKAGVLMGLGLYATGALLFFPAKGIGIYGCFLLAYFIMTCGLSFLETSCNPYILTMGPEETATRRLNMAQCFNPCGSIIGMFVAMNFIQARLNPMSSDERALLGDSEFEALKKKIDHHDLSRDLDAHREEIQQMIEQDIVSAYYFQAGQMQVGLRTDKTLREAERILTTEAEYVKLLGYAQKAASEQSVDKNATNSVK